MKINSILFIFLLLFLYQFSFASNIPKIISYQGKLTSVSGGTPVNDTIPFIFKIYDVSSGGSALLTENHTIAVIDGMFTAELGSVTPINLSFDKQYWIGVNVNNDGEMSPREKIKTAPYSFAAIVSDTANNVLFQNVIGDTVTKSYVDSLLGIVSADTSGLSYRVVKLESDSVSKQNTIINYELRIINLEADSISKDRRVQSTEHFINSINDTYYKKSEIDTKLSISNSQLNTVASDSLVNVNVSKISGIIYPSNIPDSFVKNFESDTISGILIAQEFRSEKMYSEKFILASTLTNNIFQVGSDSLVVLRNGNIGIGVSNPANKLEVNGTINATTFIGDGSGIVGIGSGTGGIQNAGSTTIGADSDVNGIGDIAFQTRRVTRILVKSDGNIGIGATSPSDSLTISGTLSADSATFRDTVIAAYFIGDGSRLTGINFSGIVTGAVNGGHIADNEISNNDIASTAAISPYKIDTSAIRLGDNQILAGINSLKIDTSSLRIQNANVLTGIDAVKIGGGTIDNTEFGYLNNVTSAIQAQIDLKAPLSAPVFTGNLIASDSLLVGADTFVVKKTGNVGIGTSNPLAKLHVEGNIYLDNGATINDDLNTGKYIKISDGSAYMIFNAYSGLSLNSYNGTIWKETLRTNNQGYVGIGTSTISDSLTIKGSVKAETLTVSNFVYANKFYGDGSGLSNISVVNAGSINSVNILDGSIADADIGNTAAVSGIKIDTSLLRIGSTQIVDGEIINADISNSANIAASKLDTSGLRIQNSNILSGIDVLKLGGGTIDNTEFSYLNGVTSALQSQIDLKSPIASPAFTGNVTMPGTGIWNSSGNVGIGTTSPGYKLDANGDVNLRTSVLRINGSVGSNGQVLTSNGTTVSWATPSAASTVTGSSFTLNGSGAANMYINVGGAGGDNGLHITSTEESWNFIVAGGFTGDIVLFPSGAGWAAGMRVQKGSPGSWIAASDKRLKNNIINIENGLEIIKQLRPIKYRLISNPNSLEVGFIAQEAEKFIPEAVVPPRNENEFYGIKYDRIAPYLTNAIQEQQKIIENQQSKIEILEKEIADIKSQLKK